MNALRPAAFALAAFMALGPGTACCSPTPDAPASANADANGAGVTNGAEGPTAALLLASHGNELARLPTLVSGGFLELTWHDDSGRHFEQGDLDLRFRAPVEISLRLSKVGETHILGGSNAKQWWWYDGLRTPKRLSIGSLGADRRPRSISTAEREGAGGPPIAPEELLGLLGLREFRSSRALAHPSDVEGRWIVEIPPSESPFRLLTRAVFAPSQAVGAVGWSLVRLKLVDESGGVVVDVTYEGHRRIERRGAATGDWPVIATRIRLAFPPRGGRPGGEWLIVLDRPSATGERIVERLFDPEAIRTTLRPDVVDEEQGTAP